MSEKRRFIQAVVARAIPAIDQVGPAIAHAERLWSELTSRGYGDAKAEKKATGMRERTDWASKLQERQAGFDRFWAAYDYKKGKNEAAMVWAKLFEPRPEGYGLPPHELEWIVASAKKEAQLWREAPPSQVRIYAQGWLSAYRWRDWPPPGTETNTKESRGYSAATLRSMSANELNHLKRLYQQAPNDMLAAQIKALDEKIHGPG